MNNYQYVNIYFSLIETKYRVTEMRVWNANPGNGAKQVYVGFTNDNSVWSDLFFTLLEDRDGHTGPAEAQVIPFHFAIDKLSAQQSVDGAYL